MPGLSYVYSQVYIAFPFKSRYAYLVQRGRGEGERRGGRRRGWKREEGRGGGKRGRWGIFFSSITVCCKLDILES